MTTSLTLVIGLLPFVEILLLGLVIWVTIIGSLELSLLLYNMSLRKRCYTNRVLMMVLH
jgi:hypothetical protein